MVLYLIASGKPGFSLAGGLASNGFGDHSPGGYSLLASLVAEVVLTMMFLFIILGSTDDRAPRGFAPLAIGLGLTLIHLVGIPVTNLSVNPARSTGPAIVVGGGRSHNCGCSGSRRLEVRFSEPWSTLPSLPQSKPKRWSPGFDRHQSARSPNVKDLRGSYLSRVDVIGH